MKPDSVPRHWQRHDHAYANQAPFELNVMMPLMVLEILFSTEILKNYLPVLVEKRSRIEPMQSASRTSASPSLATALNPLGSATPARPKSSRSPRRAGRRSRKAL
jgi:fumarate hydratase class II